MADRFEFRSVFNTQSVEYTANQITTAYPPFQKKAFIQSVLNNFDSLGYKERIERISTALHTYLPIESKKALKVLVNALGDEIADDKLEGYEGFYVIPMCDYIAKYTYDEFQLSLQAQVEMTKRFSAEYSIRTFLQKEPQKTLAFLHTLTTDKNPHVRRLVSEGTRPRLPLGIQLKAFIKNPDPVLELLNALKNEPTRLVQRSIANNLNDISKDHPQKAVAFLQRWKSEGVRDYLWIQKHATRTLIKRGHKATLELLRYKIDIKASIKNFHLQNTQITLGDTLAFQFELISKERIDQAVIIDYILYFKKANGTLKAKVFKLKTVTLPALDKLTIEKKHPLKFATTRKYYSGIQKIAIQVNGSILSETLEFTLKV